MQYFMYGAYIIVIAFGLKVEKYVSMSYHYLKRCQFVFPCNSDWHYVSASHLASHLICYLADFFLTLVKLSVLILLGGLHVTNPPIRLMCPTSVCPSVCPSTFLFPDSNSKMLCPIEFKLDREIDHHHS